MKRSLVIIIMLGLFLSACGQNRQEQIAQQDSRHDDVVKEDDVKTEIPETLPEEKKWVIDELALPDEDAALKELIPQGAEIFTDEWFLVKETVYRAVTFINSDESVSEEEYFKGHCVQKLEAPYTEWINTFIAPEDWLDGELCEPWTYFSSLMTENGFAVLLEGRNGTYIGTWNEKTGTAVSEIDSSFLMTEDSEKYPHWWRGKEGDIWVWDDNKCINIGTDNTISGKLEREEGYYGTTVAENERNGIIYMSYPAEASYDPAISGRRYSGIQIASRDGKQVFLTSMDIHASQGDILCFITEEKGYLYGSEYISEFSLKEGTMDLLYDFSQDAAYYDKMYNARKPLKYMHAENGIQGAWAKEDGSHVLLVACSDESWQIWKMHEEKKEDAKSAKQKETLEWAVTVPEAYEEQAAAMFNQQNEKYEIVFRMPDEGEDFEDFRNRIRAELAAGKGPDILTEGSVIGIDDGVRAGFLADITEYFTDYEEDMLASAWQSGVIENRRYAAPYKYTITTLVTNQDFVNGREQWTLQEAVKCMENSDADCFIAGMETDELFFYLGLQSEANSQLIDWQNRICHLDSGEAQELLLFADRYADTEGTKENAYLSASEGKAAAAIMYLMRPDDMRAAAAMFQNKEVYIGFPAENGESGHVLSVFGLAVNQGSANVEGAAAFIRFLVSEDVQEDLAARILQGSATGFPVRNSAMEQVYRSLKEEEDLETVYTSNGLQYALVSLSEETIQGLRELSESARPMGDKANQLFTIVGEEVRDFRSEGKTATQVLAVVNNRAQLYLNEMDD